jgi:hypothetical protein
MHQISRRGFNQELLGSLLTFSLLETLFTSDAFADEIKPIAAKWLANLDQLGRDLKGQKLKQTEWQQQVESLCSRVDLPELLRLLDFDKLTADVKFRDQGETSLKPKFPQVEGLPTELVFGHQIFALTEGRSVVLQGDFHGRHYDRLEDDSKETMIIRPTIDRPFKVGEYSTVSDHKDNIHWFTAASKSGFIFNIHVMNVVEGRESGRVYIDPHGEKLAGGRIRAKRLKPAEAIKLYG